MLKNRSVPTDILLPHIVYQNVVEARDWLVRVFGFTENYHYGNPVQGVQLYLGNAYIMIHDSRPASGCASPSQTGHRTQSLTVFIEDVDGQLERVRSAGAKIVEELQETAYGERQFGVEDLEGHQWLFSRHVRDVSPEEWGAVTVKWSRLL